MRWLRRLFGWKRRADDPDEVAKLALRMSELLHTCLALNPDIKHSLQHPAKRRAILCYFFGFLDCMGQYCKLLPESILETATLAFIHGLQMSATEAAEAVSLVTDASGDEDGRRLMIEGARCLGGFLAQKNNIPDLQSLRLILQEIK